MKSKVVFIGGLEVGKTSSIQYLWADEAISYYNNDAGISICEVKEMIPGREIMEYDVIELPRIRYATMSSEEYAILYADYFSNADVIVIMLPINDVSINTHKEYIHSVLKKVALKQHVVILIALSKTDIVLTPIAANNMTIDKNEKIELSAITSVLQKCSKVYSSFKEFENYDKTFDADAVIPFSRALEWNCDDLKYHIWNGIVISTNESIFDPNLPTVVLAGKTGCGKSSTINALWDKELAVDRAVSCTKFPAVMRIKDLWQNHMLEFNLVDLPGIAESIEANSLYHNFYYDFIERADVLICLTQADRRAYKQDELFYSDLIQNNILRPTQKIILGINQADLLFKSEDHPEGIAMEIISDDDDTLRVKIDDLFNGVFSHVFSSFNNVSRDSVIPFSVLKSWNLINLKNKIYTLIYRKE